MCSHFVKLSAKVVTTPLNITILSVSDEEDARSHFDLCEGMPGVPSQLVLRGSSISPVSARQRKDTGCDLLNAGHPLVLFGQHGGTSGTGNAMLRSPSSFSSSELCSIEALLAHSHVNAPKGRSRCETFGSVLVHLLRNNVPRYHYFTFFVLLRVIKTRVRGGGHLLWWP